MKRLYLRSGNTVTASIISTIQILGFLPTDAPVKFGEVESKSIPSPQPTTRTRHAYLEQSIEDRTTGEIVGVLREGKIETLNKLTNPIYDSTSDAARRQRALIAKASANASITRRASQPKSKAKTKHARNTLRKVRKVPNRAKKGRKNGGRSASK